MHCREGSWVCENLRSGVTAWHAAGRGAGGGLGSSLDRMLVHMLSIGASSTALLALSCMGLDLGVCIDSKRYLAHVATAR